MYIGNHNFRFKKCKINNIQTYDVLTAKWFRFMSNQSLSHDNVILQSLHIDNTVPVYRAYNVCRWGHRQIAVPRQYRTELFSVQYSLIGALDSMLSCVGILYTTYE